MLSAPARDRLTGTIWPRAGPWPVGPPGHTSRRSNSRRFPSSSGTTCAPTTRPVWVRLRPALRQARSRAVLAVGNARPRIIHSGHISWINVTGSVTENVATTATPDRRASAWCRPASAGQTSRH